MKNIYNTISFLSRHPSQTVAEMDGDNSVDVLELAGGAKVHVIRNASDMRRLSDMSELDRGDSMNIIRSIFGDQTIVSQPRGDRHGLQKREFRDALGKNVVNKLVPSVAEIVSDSVGSMLQKCKADHGVEMDMRREVIKYLFKISNLGVAGKGVDLMPYLEDFLLHSDNITDVASSTPRSALISRFPFLGGLLAWSGRNSAIETLKVAEAIVRGTSGDEGPSPLIASILDRYKIDYKTITNETKLPQEMLEEITIVFGASIFTTSHTLMFMIDYYYSHPEELQKLREMIKNDFPDGVRGVQELENSPTTRELMVAMLKDTAVGIAGRDVLSDFSFTDCDGVEHEIKQGDMVVFDFAKIQEKNLGRAEERLLSNKGRPLLDSLDASHNDVMNIFYSGTFQCPGRFLATADSVLFLVEMLSKLDARWVSDDKHKHYGMVNYLAGSSIMNVRPAGQGLPFEEGKRSSSAPQFTARGVSCPHLSVKSALGSSVDPAQFTLRQKSGTSVDPERYRSTKNKSSDRSGFLRL